MARSINPELVAVGLLEPLEFIVKLVVDRQR